MKYNIHTHHLNLDENVVSIVNQYPNEVNSSIPQYSIGIHPWYINELRLNEDLLQIKNKVNEKGFLAIGECGLDKSIETSIEIQKKVFVKQLLIAEEYKKPVILHCVSAYQEMIEIKKEHKISVPMVIHGFSKNEQVAKSLYQNGFYLSFGKYLLRNPDLGNVLKTIPIDRVFLETDTMQETIHQVYEKANAVYGFDIELEIENNFNRVFNP